MLWFQETFIWLNRRLSVCLCYFWSHWSLFMNEWFTTMVDGWVGTCVHNGVNYHLWKSPPHTHTYTHNRHTHISKVQVECFIIWVIIWGVSYPYVSRDMSDTQTWLIPTWLVRAETWVGADVTCPVFLTAALSLLCPWCWNPRQSAGKGVAYYKKNWILICPQPGQFLTNFKNIYRTLRR